MTSLPTETSRPLPAFEVLTSSIIVGDRVRTDFGDIKDLADSIAANGLIQPIVVTSDHRLIAGERRLRAHRLIGAEYIKVVYLEVLDEGHRTMLEATENLIRRDFDWKETVLAIDKVHRLKTNENAFRGEEWGVRETGRLLNSSKSNIGRAVRMASYIRKNDPEILAADNLTNAFKILLKRQEDYYSAALLKSSLPPSLEGRKIPTQPFTNVPVKQVDDEDFFLSGTTGFTPGISGPVDLDESPGVAGSTASTVIPLSSMFFNEDSRNFCQQSDPESYDAVITDWPYAIDMANISQDGGGKDVSATAAEHGVDENEQLQKDIIPLLYRLLKPNSWFITWTDISQWQRNVDMCTAAGFKVQRWPLIWHKTSACQNMASQYNFTKNYEIAIVCRKGAATLLRSQASSVWTGGTDVETKTLGHPFAKPAGLWEWLYAATCLRGSSVLDPFVGCGSSSIPAVKFGIRPTGVEKVPAHHASLIVNMTNYYKSVDPTCTIT
jgi:ParB/RepB/Spo0J family partition protein